MYQFFTAAVTNCHKLGDLKQHILKRKKSTYLLHVAVLEVRSLKRFKVLARLPFGSSGENLFPFVFQLLEATVFFGFWPLLPIFKASSVASFYLYIGPTQMIQDNLYISLPLNLIRSAKSLLLCDLLCEVTHSQVPEIRTWISWRKGALFCYYICIMNISQSGLFFSLTGFEQQKFLILIKFNSPFF